MNLYGLIGFPLGHSLSKQYFTDKFIKESINADFVNFEIENITEFENILSDNPTLKGLSVTIPHKENIMPLLSEIDAAALSIGAVNSVKIDKKGNKIHTTGYNTDYLGFGYSLDNFLGNNLHKALILGSGGASKAVAYALEQRNISYKVVSRNPKKGQLEYGEVNHKLLEIYKLIVNTTPLGTSPDVDMCPMISYEDITPEHYLYDLVYNPTETLFLKKGKEKGVQICNGLSMLKTQAEVSWKLWNK